MSPRTSRGPGVLKRAINHPSRTVRAPGLSRKQSQGARFNALVIRAAQMKAPVTTASVERILSVNNIEVVYNHVMLVLKGVSLRVPKGGIVALLGANGAGKTTTLKAISNLLHTERGKVTKGTIVFDGTEVHD